jgi:hypothetical protein
MCVSGRLILLRHEIFCLVGGNLRAQQGHRGRATYARRDDLPAARAMRQCCGGPCPHLGKGDMRALDW